MKEYCRIADLRYKEVINIVTGARLGGPVPTVVTARAGVVLAAGGFGGDPVLRRTVFTHDDGGDDHVTPTVGHGGDSHRLGSAVGGALDVRAEQIGGRNAGKAAQAGDRLNRPFLDPLIVLSLVGPLV